MTKDRLGELLDRPAPGEREAGERSHRVAGAAFEEREGPRRPRARSRPLVLVLATLLAAVAITVALTPAGGAIADWIREDLGAVVEGEPDAEPALVSLPSAGELLVTSRQGPWVVQEDGSQRLLGRYADASWSPQGLYVIASRGHQLAALTPQGEVRWSLSRPGGVAGPRWAPSGVRVAYLSGASLRVVDGDGTDDGLLAERAASTPPAWRPGERNVVAFADRAGRVRVLNADTSAAVWRSEPGERPAQLAWSSDGERLLAVARGSLRIFDREGRLLRRVPLPNAIPPAALRASRAAAFAREGHSFALIRASRTPGQSEVVLIDAERSGAPRQLFEGPGSFSELAWSPDASTLLVGWPSADQWIFLRPDRPRRVSAVSHLRRQFSPGAAGRFPGIAGWCCPRYVGGA